MRNAAPIAREEAARSAEEATAHPQSGPLGLLAFDVLSRQAEGRALFGGRDYLETRADEHGVDRDKAQTSAGDLLTMLERGPSDAREAAVVSAFAAHGLAQRLDGDGRDATLRRFVDHAEWLERCSPYAVFEPVDRSLSDEQAAALWTTVADVLLSEGRTSTGAPNDRRARAALWLSALAASTRPCAAEGIRRIAATVEDPLVRAMAVELGGGPEPQPASSQIRGRPARAPAGPVRALLRIVTGFALVVWLVRTLAMLVGSRREGEMELVSGAVRVRRRVVLLGRTVRESEATYSDTALAGVVREVRYPALTRLVGLVALCSGVLLGGILAFDSVRSGETALLMIAAAVVAGGAGLDLVIDVLVPGRRGRVTVELTMLGGRSERLTSVPIAEADPFVDALARRVRRTR